MNEAVLPVRERLAAGPRRGLGCAAEVAADAVRDEATRRELVSALRDRRAVVVARAANALKKAVESDARVLDGFASQFLADARICEVIEARWNLWLLLGRVRLSSRQRAAAVDMLFEAVGSASALERVHALQSLTDLSLAEPRLRERVRTLLERASDESSAAVRARARKLLRAGQL